MTKQTTTPRDAAPPEPGDSSTGTAVFDVNPSKKYNTTTMAQNTKQSTMIKGANSKIISLPRLKLKNMNQMKEIRTISKRDLLDTQKDSQQLPMP